MRRQRRRSWVNRRSCTPAGLRGRDPSPSLLPSPARRRRGNVPPHGRGRPGTCPQPHQPALGARHPPHYQHPLGHRARPIAPSSATTASAPLTSRPSAQASGTQNGGRASLHTTSPRAEGSTAPVLPTPYPGHDRAHCGSYGGKAATHAGRTGAAESRERSGSGASEESGAEGLNDPAEGFDSRKRSVYSWYAPAGTRPPARRFRQYSVPPAAAPAVSPASTGGLEPLG